MGFWEFGEGNVQTEAEQELLYGFLLFLFSVFSFFIFRKKCHILHKANHWLWTSWQNWWEKIWMTHYGKKNTNKESHVTWNCPQCFLSCRTVQTGSIMLKSKLPHKCLYKVIRSCTGRPATQVGLLLRCICNWKEELFYFLIFVLSMLLFLFLFGGWPSLCFSN